MSVTRMTYKGIELQYISNMELFEAMSLRGYMPQNHCEAVEKEANERRESVAMTLAHIGIKPNPTP